jgi:diacylglycerol kinase (ATP)
VTGSVAVIVNPAAGRGKAALLLPELRDSFGRYSKVLLQTRSSGDEEALTQRALRNGATTIVAVGGDGTCGRIADVILRNPHECALSVVPCGTGNDFAKTLGIQDYTPQQVAELVSRNDSRRIDVGLADGHYFLNSCGFGFDASVLEASNRVRFLTGDAVYVYSALRQLFSYRGVDVSISGAAGVKDGRMLMVTVSIGRFLGGLFKIAPNASVLDGKLDVCFIGDSNVAERVNLFVGAMRGAHLGMRSVSTASVQKLSLAFTTNPLMEMDGELRRAKSESVELECVPRALPVIAAPGALA